MGVLSTPLSITAIITLLQSVSAAYACCTFTCCRFVLVAKLGSFGVGSCVGRWRSLRPNGTRALALIGRVKILGPHAESKSAADNKTSFVVSN